MKILDALSAAWHTLKATYTTSTLHLSSWWQGVVASWGGISYDALARRAYRNPTAARGLRLVSQLMASVPFAVEAGDEMVTDHEMLRLLERPNPRTSRGLLFDQLTAHLYCAGEVFVHRITPDGGPNAGRPTASGGELRLLSPGAFTEFIKDGAGQITGYRFSSSGRTETYTTDEVLHIRFYNPLDEERGMPLLLGAARALEQVEAADQWNKSIAQGGGRIPGYFMPKTESGQMLTPEQVATAQEQADRATLERRARHLPQVMSGAFDYQQGAMTLRDADFLKAGEANARRVAAVIGVMYELIGAEQSGSLTDAGVNSYIRAVYLLTVLPLLDFVLAELNAWLSSAYGGARLSYDRDQIEALDEDVNSVFDRYVKATGGPFLTVDEAREANGYEPMGGTAAEVREKAADRQAAPPPVPVRSSGDGATFDLDGVRAAVRAHFQKETTEN